MLSQTLTCDSPSKGGKTKEEKIKKINETINKIQFKFKKDIQGSYKGDQDATT